jgi:hypothetical protein
MANPEHLVLLKQGADRWNRWYKEHYWDTTPDLRGADLSNMDLSDVKLSFARLEEACFSGSNLQRASFVESRLIHVDLSHTNLREAHLDRAWLLDANLQGAQLHAAKIRKASLAWVNLNDAVLSHANLESTYLNGTGLRSTDLSFARIGSNTFINIDFSAAHGLETVGHTGPTSLVDMRTLFRSQGRIPEPFLRDAGFSENLMSSAHALDSRSAAFPTCLLSYARDDRAFAEQLLNDLQARGVFCHAEPSEDTTGKLITIHDKLLLILSSSSPGWRDSVLPCILKEARVKAYWEAPSWEASRILRPISLDDTLQAKIAAWPGSYRRVMWPHSDFSGWHNRDTYQKALSRLLGDLRHESNQRNSEELPPT